MTVLLLDNFLDTKYSAYFSQYYCDDLDIHRPPDMDFPEDINQYSHVILSGSEESIISERDWMSWEMELVRGLVAQKIPTLGICFGHQLIARALLGRAGIRRSLTPEIGWKEISITHPGGIFEGLGDSFHIFVSHFDEAVNLPDDFEVLAHTKDCPAHAFKLRDLPVWGLQFHPEIDIESGKRFIEDIRKRWDGRDVNLDAEIEGARDSGVSEKLFRNFYAVSRPQ